MTSEEFVKQYPRAWHMAHDGSWPAIQAHGLLSAAALLDLYEVAGEQRSALLSRQRPTSVPIARAGLPGAVIRDQKPMSDGALLKCLPADISPSDWYELLNGMSFFWLSRKRLRRLLKAKAYREHPQVVLTLDTATIMAAHSERIRLSPINSGSTIFRPVKRDRNTFLPIGDYPFSEWSRKRTRADAVAELCVEHGVPDVADHVLAVHRVVEGQPTVIYRRPGASDQEGP